MAVGWPPLAAVAEASGPETAAQAKVTQRPALTHSLDRPRGPARKVPPRAGPGRAASVSPAPGRAGAWPAGRAGGQPGPSYLWKETARFSPLPCRLEQFAAAQQITISGLGRRDAARLRPSPRRAEPGAGPPRGEARRYTAAGRGSRPPRRRTARWRRPPPGRRPSALGSPEVSGTRRGAARGSRRRGWAGAPGPAAPYGDMARRARPYGKMAAPASPG